jgi:ferrochelatase
MTREAYDAVLLIGFGGPTAPDQIRPFLEHVLRGRPVPPGRIDEVAHHYEAIGGRSPFNDYTELQRAALQQRLAATGAALPVRMGMWHAEPFVIDVLRELTRAGARRLLGVVMASFYDSTTLQRYAMVVDEARQKLGHPDLQFDYIRSPEQHAGFIEANADRIQEAFAKLPEDKRADARLMFTAHSVPTAIGQNSGYVASFETAAMRIARKLGRTDYRCVYQSRSGGPNDSWLEPDVCDALRQEGAGSAVVLAPIGFVCDHVEVLYDLDVEAREVANTLGISLARAGTVGAHPQYIEALASEIRERGGGRNSW